MHSQIGLFSAIVAAFFVESSKNLKQDEGARTNQLLANLTSIFLAINRVDFATLNLPYASPYAPEPSDVRLNAFWSIALVLSVCTD